jgi:hypothetical protein
MTEICNGPQITICERAPGFEYTKNEHESYIYDAVKIVSAFSSTLRQEVDLGTSREQLVAVVQETMQPAHVSLWLRPPEHDGKQRVS